MLITFHLFLGAGASLGLALVYLRSQRPEASTGLSAAGWVLAGGLLGARVAFVTLNWVYYRTHMPEAWQIWAGGLDGAGAMAGALVALGLLAIIRRQPLGATADHLLPMLLPLLVAVWLGCWQDGCAYGSPNHTWWAVPAIDEWGHLERRVPVQLLGALLGMVSLGAVDYYGALLKRPGQAASLGALAVGLQKFGLSFLRHDADQVWRAWRLESWLALAWVAISLILCLAAFLPVRKKGK